MERSIVTCIVCPIGCSLEVIGDRGSESGYLVKGNRCNRGIEYAIAEVTNPVRILTTTVKLHNACLRRLPVRTDKPVPKGLLLDCMKVINSVEVDTPIALGTVIIENILSTGANVISSRTV